MKKAAETILICLKEKGMTQSELAKRIGRDVRLLNRDLRKSSDIKTEVFIKCMECMGYGVTLEENDICRVVVDFARQIIETSKPVGKFYSFDTQNGVYIGIVSNGNVDVENFEKKQDCLDWLHNKEV